jgi:hypothetical protein
MLGYESQEVNGQLVNVAPAQGYAPLTFGSMYTGPGMWPRNGVYNVPPVAPSPGTWEGTAVAGATPAAVGAPGGGTSPSAGAVNSSGGVNWLHPTKSPVVFGFLFLAVSLLMLHFVHYK